MQKWSIKQTASTLSFHHSLMTHWPFTFSKNKHPVTATFITRWQQFPEGFWMTSVHLINLCPGVLCTMWFPACIGLKRNQTISDIVPTRKSKHPLPQNLNTKCSCWGFSIKIFITNTWIFYRKKHVCKHYKKSQTNHNTTNNNNAIATKQRLKQIRGYSFK